MKTRKQPVAKHVSAAGKKVGNVVERQVESRVTHSYLKEDQYDVSKLDLIFRSEPQQIQAKLMKLLISYNAHMQYNHQTDMFEVDLLLPFLNEQQKRQFVKQFLEIRKQKQVVTPAPQIQVEERESEVREPVSSQPSSKSKDNRRFSFNIKEQDNEYSSFYKKEDEMLDQLNYEQQLIDKQVGKILFVEEKDRTAEFKQIKQIKINEAPQPKKPPPIDLHEVAVMFDQRIKSAISIINRRKGKDQINKQNIEAAKSAPEEEVHKKEEDSIIYQLSAGNSSFNNTKNMSNSEYIREDLGDEEELFEGREESKEEHSHNTHDYRYQQIIEEQEEYDEYQPLFQPIPVPVTKNKPEKKDKNVTSFEEYTKKYSSVKQQKGKGKPKHEVKPAAINRTNPRNVGKPNNQVTVDISRNYQSSKQRPSEGGMVGHPQQRKSLKSIGDKSPIRSGSREQPEREKQSSRDHSKSSEKGSVKQSRSRKPNFKDFFTAHRQHLQKIYSRIRGNINMAKPQSKREKQQVEKPAGEEEYYPEPPPKASDDMYILVLDELQQEPDMTQNESTMEALNNEQFKEEIMKDYQKEILVSNRNLSSEDLIRYFKFLHSNAKKLYLKFLKSNKK